MHTLYARPLRKSPGLARKQKQSRFVKRLKLEATPQEIMLYGALVAAFQPYRVTVCFQEPIGPYVADFFIYPLNLVIEVDGKIHELPHVAERDRRRNTFMRNRGIRVMRFANDEVAMNPPAIAVRIIAELGDLPKIGDPVRVTKCPPGSAIHNKPVTRKNTKIHRLA